MPGTPAFLHESVADDRHGLTVTPGEHIGDEPPRRRHPLRFDYLRESNRAPVPCHRSIRCRQPMFPAGFVASLRLRGGGVLCRRCRVTAQYLGRRGRERPPPGAPFMAPRLSTGVAHAPRQCPRVEPLRAERRRRHGADRASRSVPELDAHRYRTRQPEQLGPFAPALTRPSRDRVSNCARRRQCSSLRFDPASRRAFGH